MAADKVQYNLKNVHYAIQQVGDNGAISYGTPKHVPGAVSLTCDPEGETSTYYADGIKYFVSSGNDGYTGSLEMALIPASMRADIWGMEVNSKGVQMEDAEAETKVIALLFEVDGDQHGRKNVLYGVTLTRPGMGSKTNDGSKEPQNQTCELIAAPVNINGKMCPMANTTAEVDATVDANWFKSVYMGETT